MLKPEELLHFVETRSFTKDWGALGLDDEDDLASLQFAIMRDPTSAPVVRGTGGLRKVRCSPPSWNRGKRGALRVCYVHFADFGIALLVTVYTKATKDNLSDAERSDIKRFIAHQRELLEKGFRL